MIELRKDDKTLMSCGINYNNSYYIIRVGQSDLAYIRKLDKSLPEKSINAELEVYRKVSKVLYRNPPRRDVYIGKDFTIFSIGKGYDKNIEISIREFEEDMSYKTLSEINIPISTEEEVFNLMTKNDYIEQFALNLLGALINN